MADKAAPTETAPEPLLRLSPNHADLAALHLTYVIQDAGEGLERGSGYFQDELRKMTHAAEAVAGIGEVILELRTKRETAAVKIVERVVRAAREEIAPHLGNSYLDVLRSQREDATYEPGPGFVSWSTVKDSHSTGMNRLTDEAMNLQDILDAIDALREVG
jgi:hypothetical protein